MAGDVRHGRTESHTGDRCPRDAAHRTNSVGYVELGVKCLELGRPAVLEKENDRLAASHVILDRRANLLGCQQVGQRETTKSQAADGEQLPATATSIVSKDR